jgi:hypothetical protein
VKRALFIFALLPALAFGQVLRRDTGFGTFSGSVTADSFTATAGSGSNGYHQSTGAYLDLGDGPDDYLYSDGLLVHSAAPVDFPLGINSGGTVTRGMQSIVMAKPVNATFTLGSGTLVAGTYCYRVTASTLAGETDPSTETCLTIGAGDAPAGVNVNWAAIPGAIVYKVYGRTTGAEELLTTISNIPVATPTWLDSGSGTPSGAMPTKNESGVISSPSFNSTAVAGDVAYRQADDTKMCLDLADTSCLTATTSLITASAPVSMPSLTTTAASGAVGIQGVTGQKWCTGTAASGCIWYVNGRVYTSSEIEAPQFTGGAATTKIRSLVADSASAVAFSVRNYYTLVTPGARIATFSPDNDNTVKASIDKDGMLQFGIGNTGAAPTCDATTRGTMWLVNGGTGVTDTVSLCLKAAADTYSWITLTTGG